MAKILTYKNHLKKTEDLVTSKEQTRAGFIALAALEKNYLAVPYVEEAKTLKILAGQIKTPKDLLEIEELFPSLLSASGLSEKSLKYLTYEDQKIAIKGLIDEFLEPAGKTFVDELVYRYLLTKGDALGGQTRNLTGVLGERKFIRTLLSVLNIYQIPYHWMDKNSHLWFAKPPNDIDLEKKLKAISWFNKKKNRILILNANVSTVKKNIDISLLNGLHTGLILKGRNSKRSIHREASRYIALGELKGGIDPAGADEHWKTANTALTRIRNSFKKLKNQPSTFFIGAAIEPSMAKEIFEQINNKTLTNAANLTVNEQLTSICNWLIHL